jgi:hypothetical protein
MKLPSDIQNRRGRNEKVNFLSNLIFLFLSLFSIAVRQPMSQVILPAIAHELPAEPIELQSKGLANMEQPPKPPRKIPLNPTVEDEQARKCLSATSNTAPAVTDKPPPLPGNRPATNNEFSSSQPAPPLAPELLPRQAPDNTTPKTTSNAPDLPPRNTVPNRWSGGPFLRTPQSNNKPNEFLYTRDSHKMIVYFVPFPKPIDAPDDMPQVCFSASQLRSKNLTFSALLNLHTTSTTLAQTC